MTWHYRIMRYADGLLALHEVYCGENGQPNSCTVQPITFVADAEEGEEALVRALRRALSDAMNRPVLDMADMEKRGAQQEALS